MNHQLDSGRKHILIACQGTTLTSLLLVLNTSFEAMAAAPREASSLIHSTAALRERAAKAGLSSEEVQAILDNNVTSIAQMAFAISPPGASPTEQQVRDFYQSIAVNMGTITIITSTKLLIFEAHTLVVANIKSEVGRKDDVTTHCVLPSAEREGRIQDQQKRLTGLRFKGDEEVAFLAYDLGFHAFGKRHPDLPASRTLHHQTLWVVTEEAVETASSWQWVADHQGTTCRPHLGDQDRTWAGSGTASPCPGIWLSRHRLIEGSLEVKLPTIWTDEKQSREEAERRERLEERRVEEKE